MTEAEGGQPVVLVVEDEPLIWMLAAEILEDEGFAVGEAATAPAALKLLEKREDVTALFTDIDSHGHGLAWPGALSCFGSPQTPRLSPQLDVR